MSSIFNAPEIIDVGIEKEKKRMAFYDLVSKKFEVNQMKELFERLRDWEKEHVEKFSRIKENIKESQTGESYAGEMSDYANALLDDTLYKQVSAGEFSKNVKTPLAAIQYGISFEKDAILFFSEMLASMADHDKDTIKTLIGEEKQHIIYLDQLKKKIKK